MTRVTKLGVFLAVFAVAGGGACDGDKSKSDDNKTGESATTAAKPAPAPPEPETDPGAKPAPPPNEIRAPDPLPDPGWVGEDTTDVTVKGVGAGKPFIITAPKSFELAVSGEDEDETLPFATLTGDGVEVWIGFPDLDFQDLATYEKITSNGDANAKTVRGEENPDGVVYVHVPSKGSDQGKHVVVVTRPKQEVECNATVATRVEAERVVAMCQTIRR